MSTLTEGLQLSAIGLLLTFGALGGLILVMVVLERLFGTRPALATAAEPPAVPPEPAVIEPGEPEVATAIAVALSYWRQQDRQRSGLGATLAEGRGPWWQPAWTRALAEVQRSVRAGAER